MGSRKRILLLIVPVILLTAAALAVPKVRNRIRIAVAGERTLAEVISALEPTAEPIWRRRAESTGAGWPPRKLTLLGFKEERKLQVWTENGEGPVLLHSYGVLGASGGPGPKLREGDRQVPEGIYPVTFMNPNSAYHLSFQVGYPNDFDRKKGAEDGREALGGEIFIHGGDLSIGCLAIGDGPIEELFWLVDHVGTENVTVIILPAELGSRSAWDTSDDPAWVNELYEELRQNAAPFLDRE